MRPTDDQQAGFTLVELLVVILILGVVSGATFTVVLSAQRSQRFTEQVQDATNDARLSVERIRQQLRMSRLVTQPSGPSGMRFWVDENQDGLQDVGEVLCYGTRQVEPGRYELLRWRDVVGTPAANGTNCSGFVPPADAAVLARTLRNLDIFQYSTASDGFTPVANPATTISNDPPVRRVDVRLAFDVFTSTGPQVFTTGTKVRLRNVP